MSIELLGKPVIQSIKKEVQLSIEWLKSKNIVPKIGIVQVGERIEDISYRNSITKKFNSQGVKCEIYNLKDNITTKECICKLENINNDKSIHGILLFRPLPKHLDENKIRDSISPIKDVDCMNSVNLEKVFEGDKNGFAPCTPSAVVEMLKYYDIELEGANVVIINRSMVVGKPLSMMLLSENATVTICNSKTKNLSEITSRADIVVTAVGRPKFFDSRYFNENSVVIDVGINQDDNGKICGDVDYIDVKDKVKAITPVPRGVGGVTTYVLLKNLVKACTYIVRNDK